jgi:hypothetical protein
MSGIVECHSEFAYAEKPVALTWEGQRFEIAETLASWRTPDGRHFRVRTDDGQTFELLYLESTDEWKIHQP